MIPNLFCLQGTTLTYIATLHLNAQDIQNTLLDRRSVNDFSLVNVLYITCKICDQLPPFCMIAAKIYLLLVQSSSQHGRHRIIFHFESNSYMTSCIMTNNVIT